MKIEILKRFMDYDLELVGSCDVNYHMNIGHAKCSLLLVVNYDHVPILHG